MQSAAGSEDGTYDYIVVGSGAGGGTVAARLAEAGMRVLVLEAGGDPCAPELGPGAETLPEQYDVPAFHPLASENPAISWNFFVRHYADAARQARDPKATPQGVLYPRAGTLGGCTAHNAMITLWPPEADWDAMAELAGDASWRGAAMRRYLRRIERCRHRPFWHVLSRLGIDPTGHGWNGWLQTENAAPPQVLDDHRLLRMLVLETVRLGLDAPGPLRRLWHLLRGQADPNDRRIRGPRLCYTPLCTERGHRRGARERLLSVAARHPDRLHLRLHALATRVSLDERGRAAGVEYIAMPAAYRASPHPHGGGETRHAACAREVVLSGGAFNTPQLLMLSGVGEAAALRSHGIAVQVELPGVGRNLQDRYEVAVSSRMTHDWRVLDGARFRRGDPLYKEWEQGQGLYVSNGAAFAFTACSRPDLPAPDLFCMALLAAFNGYRPGYAAQLVARHDALSVTILKAHTTDRGGRVGLRSADPRDMPRIDFDFFPAGDEADLRAMVSAVQRVRRLLRPLAERGLVAAEEAPGPAVASDAQVAAWVRDTAWGHHACGTAAIGRREAGGVLDSRLRVHGTRGLRVVDASIFPRIPGFFIAGAIYMAAEKAADALLEDAAAATPCAA